MGSWSVYCGISQIAITAGDECILLPLHKAKYQEWDYFTHHPATLPIFGSYNDYGGIEEIQEDENTKLIEEHFGVSIQKFCDWFTEESTYQRGQNEPEEYQNFEEMKDWTFMWIKREVYDFMSTFVIDKGHLEFGQKEILNLIGFKYQGQVKKERYNHHWKFGQKDFYSDGIWLQASKDRGIYYFNKEEYGSGLGNFIKIPEDKKWIGEKSMLQLWKYFSPKKQASLLLSILIGRYYDGNNRLDNLFVKLRTRLSEGLMTQEEFDKFGVETLKPKTILQKYEANIAIFGKLLSELSELGHNLHPMSGNFSPYILYLTPQCGEIETHQILLDKFAEINRMEVVKREGN